MIVWKCKSEGHDCRWQARINFKKIYKCIWVSTRCAPFKLDLVTDSYIFYTNVYTNGEELLQYETADHSLEADGEFAEMGYWELVKEIRSGAETLLWGEIPEGDIDE